MENLIVVPKGDAYDPGLQVKKASKPSVATPEGIVSNIIKK